MALIKPFQGQMLPEGMRRVDGIFCEEDGSHWEFCVHAAFKLVVYFDPKRVLTGDGIRTTAD